MIILLNYYSYSITCSNYSTDNTVRIKNHELFSLSDIMFLMSQDIHMRCSMPYPFSGALLESIAPMRAARTVHSAVPTQSQRRPYLSSIGPHTLLRALSIQRRPPDWSALSTFFLHAPRHLLLNDHFQVIPISVPSWPLWHLPGCSSLSWLAVRYLVGHQGILLAAGALLDTRRPRSHLAFYRLFSDLLIA